MPAIFITGAPSGIGNAAARLFAKKGWQVIATMRRPEKEAALGAFTDCVHGEGLAVITPPYYRWLMPHAVDRFVRFAVNVWGLAPQGEDQALAAAGVEALADFIRSVGLPTTLQQLGVKSQEELDEIAGSVQTGPGTYCKCTPADVEAIFRACWE